MGVIVTDGLEAAVRYRKWIAGIPANLWVKNVSLIGQLIKTWRLQAVDQATIAPVAEVAAAGGVRKRSLIKRPPVPGGMLFPHLHLGDKICSTDRYTRGRRLFSNRSTHRNSRCLLWWMDG